MVTVCGPQGNAISAARKHPRMLSITLPDAPLRLPADENLLE
jgi:hypothetical protein